MLNADIRAITEALHRELEQTLAFPPHWLVERISGELGDSIASHLNEQNAEEVAKAILARIGSDLASVLVEKLADRFALIVAQGVTRGMRNALRPLENEFREFRRAWEEDSRDDWWRRAQREDDNADDQ